MSVWEEWMRQNIGGMITVMKHDINQQSLYCRSTIKLVQIIHIYHFECEGKEKQYHT